MLVPPFTFGMFGKYALKKTIYFCMPLYTFIYIYFVQLFVCFVGERPK